MIVSIKMDCLDFYDFKMRERLKIEFKHVHYWSTIPLSYFMTIFCFLIKDYNKAFKYLNYYIKTSKIQKDTYYDEVIKCF